jgi:hypothetical protein
MTEFRGSIPSALVMDKKTAPHYSSMGSMASLCMGTNIKRFPQYIGGYREFHPLILYLAAVSPTGLNLYPYVQLGPGGDSRG